MTTHFAKASLDENGLYYAPIDRTRRGHSDEVWLRAREAYEGGLSVQVACDRAGVSRSALHERARKEGWRRPGPRGWVTDEEVAEAAAAPPLNPAQAAEEAWEQVSLNLRLGRLAEAAAWTRLHRQFRRLVIEDEARKSKHLDQIRRDYEAFVEGLQLEAGLERIIAEDESDAADPDSPDLTELEARLHEGTSAFLKACDHRRPPSPPPPAEPDSPDSPDRFSQAAEHTPHL